MDRLLDRATCQAGGVRTPPWPRLLVGFSILCLIMSWPGHAQSRSMVESCDEIDPVDLLLGDEGCTGWLLDGDPRTAYTELELQNLINGGYELFVQHGFIGAAAQDYTGEVAGVPGQATLWIFNQTTPTNAANLYTELTSTIGGGPLAGWTGGGAAWFDAGLLNASLLFWEECIYVRVDISISGEEAKPDARCIAEATHALIRAAMPVFPGTWGRIKALYE